jgi:hypothetical protein
VKGVESAGAPNGAENGAAVDVLVVVASWPSTEMNGALYRPLLEQREFIVNPESTQPTP